MAADWIPMRIDLEQDPAVIMIAARLKIDEQDVVGRLHRLWGWANANLADGNARGVTKEWVDRYLRTPGFADATSEAGWLVVRNGSIQFPKFEEWNSQSAKKRILTAKRVAAHKAKTGNAPSVTSALPKEEKRREEKRTEEQIQNTPAPASPGGDVKPSRKTKTRWTEEAAPIPPTLNTPEFRQVWQSWIAYRDERKPAVTITAAKEQLALLDSLGHNQAILSIRASIANQWQGLFPPKNQSNAFPTKAERETQAYMKLMEGVYESTKPQQESLQ